MLIVALLVSCAAFSQSPITDTLPDFTVRNVGKNRIIIGWVNPFENVSQISIQQAFDSAGAYKTILTVADPNAVQNGVAYTKAPNDRMFYRLFVVLARGSYIFTVSKRPVKDTLQQAADQPLKQLGDTSNKTAAKAFEGLVNPPKDSGGKKPDPVAPPKPQYVPSVYVYTNNEGMVTIKLPDAERKRYHIKFFEDDGSFLFELKSLRNSPLTLDKGNFYHAGWFTFELYVDDKLVEKNKFFINKAF
ncbi:hypothetical protein V9K67_05180 [Paraflavisolibacter sp. H34]